MVINEEMRKLTIEIISNLVNIKTQMYERILKPAGISKEQFVIIKSNRNVDGKFPTKREIAQIIIKSFNNSSKEEKFINMIIEIASEWKDFYLAKDEYLARAIVQKAKDIVSLKKIQNSKDEKEKQNQEHNENQGQYKLLLMMFDEISLNENKPQQRGYYLEDLINRLFQLNDIALMESFRRNNGGEQIDGSFKMDGWYYLVEMKWTKHLSDMSQLDSLYGKVSRSGKQTMGLFISINGWSSNVIRLMKQHPDKSILLMDGYDLRVVLAQEISLIELLQKKIAEFNLKSEPFTSAKLLL